MDVVCLCKPIRIWKLLYKGLICYNITFSSSKLLNWKRTHHRFLRYFRIPQVHIAVRQGIKGQQQCWRSRNADAQCSAAALSQVSLLSGRIRLSLCLSLGDVNACHLSLSSFPHISLWHSVVIRVWNASAGYLLFSFLIIFGGKYMMRRNIWGKISSSVVGDFHKVIQLNVFILHMLV